MAVIALNIKGELEAAHKWTAKLTKQLPFATSQAVNAVAAGKALPSAKTQNVIADWRRLVSQKLDRPVKPLVNGFAQERGMTATKAKPRTLLVAKTAGGFDRNTYIKGNIRGGNRGDIWEDAFSSLGEGIPSGMRLVPSRALKRLASTGGPSRAAIKTLLRKAQAGDTGKRGAVFVGQPEGGDRPRPHGVYRRLSKTRLRAMLIAVPRTNYPKPLSRIYSVAEARVRRSWGKYIREAMEQAIKTAK